MNVVLFGATGMVGAGALLECLADPRIESVLAVVRSPTGRTHPKLREVIHADFFNYDSLKADFAACNACFFCLGVWYQAIYTLAAPLYPVLHRLLPRYSTTTSNLGRALIQVADKGFAASILYSRDINALAATA